MTSYARLFGIDLKHAYYSNGLCGDFVVAPDADSEKVLINHRCIVKPKANGIDVFVEMGDDDRPKIVFPQGATFAFELRLKNPEFPLFTDLTPLQGGADFQIKYPGRKAHNLFAKIEIQRDFNRTGGNAVEILFSTKSVRWIYFLITNQGGAGADFSLASQAHREITWKQMDGTDRIARRLADQFPGARLLRFASQQAIPCRESGLQYLQLLFGGNTVVESLPNPSWRNYFQTEMAVNGESVDAIFHVVKYLTNTTLSKV